MNMVAAPQLVAGLKEVAVDLPDGRRVNAKRADYRRWPNLFEYREGEVVRFYQLVAATDGFPSVVDVTEPLHKQMVEDLIRAKRQSHEAMQRDRERLMKSAAMTVEEWRMQHATVEEQETMQAGKKRRIVQRPLDRYFSGVGGKPSINDRQWEAGTRLANDFVLAGLMVRMTTQYQPRVTDSSFMPKHFRDDQLHALGEYRLAVRALGYRLAAVVVPVACYERTVESVAQERQQDRQEVMGVFKVGLDILGDHYRLPEKRQPAIKRSA